MKFGFNAWTDEAREKIEELGVAWKREGSTISIYTDSLDLTAERFRELGGFLDDRSVDPKRYVAQAVRVWKHPESGDYYYLLNGEPFRKYDKVTADNSTTPPTRFVVSIFDIVEEHHRQHYIDLLSQIAPLVERPI